MSGSLIFKNVIIGSYFEKGLACFITITDNGKDVWKNRRLEFQESLTYTPATDDITVTITPAIDQMKSWKGDNKHKGSGRPYDVGAGPPKSDIKYYIVEDPYVYKVSVFSNKNSVPAPAKDYI